MTSERAGLTAVAGTVVALVLALLVVVLAARTGPSGIIHGHAHDGVFHVQPPSPSVSLPPPTHPHGRIQPALATPWWVHVLQLLIAAAALFVLLVGLRAAVLARSPTWRRRRRPVVPEPGEVDWLDDPEAVAEVMQRGADQREHLLRTGTPRNAIVACWDRFEEQAEAIGLARHSWETSSEFTVRLLGSLAADPAAVDRLEGLYREARFSAHRITESHRTRAIEALDEIHASLGRVGAVET